MESLLAHSKNSHPLYLCEWQVGSEEGGQDGHPGVLALDDMIIIFQHQPASQEGVQVVLTSHPTITCDAEEQ